MVHVEKGQANEPVVLGILVVECLAMNDVPQLQVVEPILDPQLSMARTASGNEKPQTQRENHGGHAGKIVSYEMGVNCSMGKRYLRSHVDVDTTRRR
jgi:hypothetical protein